EGKRIGAFRSDSAAYQASVFNYCDHEDMEKTKKAFRLVVVRRPVQGDLFDGVDPKVRYKVIASNREETAEETVRWYNARGEHSENRIKELKLGPGMERMPCGQFGANAVFFRIGILAYNLFRMFELKVLPEEWRHHQLRTVRWRLYQVAGKVVRHAGQVYLKVRQAYYGLFAMIRRRIRIVAMV
ncbi:MAG: transposase, partial [bacterium]|nr:transposase [bacterium]